MHRRRESAWTLDSTLAAGCLAYCHFKSAYVLGLRPSFVPHALLVGFGLACVLDTAY